VVVLLRCASSALPDSVNYGISGTITGVPNAGNVPFLLTFSEPVMSTSLDTTVTVAGIASGSIINVPGAEVRFCSKADEGLLNVIFNVNNNSYDFNFLGPQIYSGNNAPFTLLTGTFPATSATVVKLNNTFLAISGSTVTATTATPEPATLALLGFGLCGIGALRKKIRLG
jgi:hypothetical protein